MSRLLGFLIAIVHMIPATGQNLAVVNPRCEYRQDPIGVDERKPRLSWELKSSQQNVLQTAYRVLVADDPSFLQKNLGNVWDSKKVLSQASIQVEYGGKALQSTKKYHWKVMVWDNKGNVSAWCNSASWQMGLLTQADWKEAKWIEYGKMDDSLIIAPHIHLNGKRSWGPRRNELPLMRKDFTVSKKIKRATAFVCGLGQFEMSLNGKKVGDHFLDPGWTNYSRQALYVTFDITDQIKTGENAVGVMLGNGFYYIPSQRYRKMTGAYGLPKLIMRIAIEYTDGTTEDIVSDKNWQTFSSPIIFSSIYGGEDYDATRELQGWNEPGFLRDGLDWFDVVVTDGPKKLESQMAEPIKVMERFLPKRMRQLNKSTSVYDLAQNFSGIPFITVNGNKGDTVRITPAELINEDGSANQRGTGSPSYFTYILKGGADESWQPRFSYYGFRYLQVQCISPDSLGPLPEIKSIEGLHIRNSATVVGSFTCSNDLFNRTNTLIDWAIKSNSVSLFTDCPHREKLGWLEQTHLMGSSVQYNYDIAGLNRKVIKDMMNAQYPNGKIPEIAPEFTLIQSPFDESPEWGSAAIILPWYNYRWYGDRQTLSEAYAMMKGYIKYLQSKSVGNILSYGLGDWFDIGPGRSGFSQMTKMGVTATATYYYDLTIMAKVARLLNMTSDMKMFEQRAAAVKKAFNDKFFDKDNLKYDSASQTANAIALYMDLVEPKYRGAVVNALVKDIRDRNNALTAGDIGYRYVLRALEEAGRNDVIFDMNNRDDVPGYGYQMKHGATALTESWQAYPNVSNNHLMLGHLMEWFYSGLAGIRSAKDAVAFNKIEIAPGAPGDVSNAKATYHSVYGDIVSEWEKNAGEFELDVEIPPNTTATVYLPATKNQEVTENGKKVVVIWLNDSAVVKIGSGKYRFKIKNVK
jgi:alpha-L-rhamnosidase